MDYIDSLRTWVQELDFEHEAANVRRCEANLEDPACRVAGRVTVPQVATRLADYSPRCMWYIEVWINFRPFR